MGSWLLDRADKQMKASGSRPQTLESFRVRGLGFFLRDVRTRTSALTHAMGLGVSGLGVKGLEES